MANEFDKILRELFRKPKLALLRQIIPDDIVEVNTLTPKVQQTITEREGDSVLEITNAHGRKYILHLEWQSTNDPQMAVRMATYDLWLFQTYNLEVKGLVLYVGIQPLRMHNHISFFGFSYTFEAIDTKRLDPDIFLNSDDPDELVFSILAGIQSREERLEIIRKILHKLQLVALDDKVVLKNKITQLEVLSILRGNTAQEDIVKEVNKMPVFIDITQDLRYREGVNIGKAEGIAEGMAVGKLEGKAEGKLEGKLEVAHDMLKMGLSLGLIRDVTGLSENTILQLKKGL